MERRIFLKNFSAGILATQLPFSIFSACSSADNSFRDWAWTGAGKDLDPDDWRRQLEKWRGLGITGLNLSGGDLEKLLPVADEEDFEIHSWIWVTCYPNKKVMEEHPEWYMVNGNGISCIKEPAYVDYYRWLCPTKPEVQEYIKKRVEDLLQYESLAAVHLDYIRYPDVILPVNIQPRYNLVQDRELPEFDYCYCEDCRKAFKEKEGIDPLDLPDPAKNEEWRKFRLDSIVDLVNMLAETVHEAGKKLSAAVFPTPDIARNLVRQDWPRFNLDDIFPMMYHRDYREDVNWIGKTTHTDVQTIQGTSKNLYSGMIINSFPVEEVKQAIDLAFENGAKGICIFGGVNDERREILRKALENHR